MHVSILFTKLPFYDLVFLALQVLLCLDAQGYFGTLELSCILIVMLSRGILGIKNHVRLVILLCC